MASSDDVLALAAMLTYAGGIPRARRSTDPNDRGLRGDDARKAREHAERRRKKNKAAKAARKRNR